MIQRITLIGAGNLATQLGKTFCRAGIEIVQVYSRTRESAKTLGAALNMPFTDKTEEIDLSADLILVAVTDDAIGKVLEQMDLRHHLVVHTAGSVPLDFLRTYTEQCGVFYPLQTFSRNRDVDFTEIPVCLEGSSPDILAELKGLAGKISASVYEINSEERRFLHLAAVFTCNFVNHFYHLGNRLLEKQGLPFDLLKPLIRETASKIMEMEPYEAQTGPARRNDEVIIGNHLNLLDNQPELREIYQLLTKSIFQIYKKGIE